jgi:hypothetical protein
MAEFIISGRLSVAGLKRQFKQEFGLELRVYKGNKFADEKATLASLSDKKVDDFQCAGNMKVGNFETKFEAATGLKVQVATISDSIENTGKLIDNDLTLSQAKTKFSNISISKKSIDNKSNFKGKEVEILTNDEENKNSQINIQTNSDIINSDNWDISSVDIKEILFTNCDGISGQDVGLSTSAFNPVNNFDLIIEYLNLLFSDDDANYLFKYKKYSDGYRFI